MPRIWTDTVDAHRVAVRAAILASAWRLAVDDGLFAVTMSRIAETAGISRATIYKYFPNVEAILTAQHLQHVEAHLERLESLTHEPTPARDRMRELFSAWTEICYERRRHGAGDVSAALHQDPAIARAEERVRSLFFKVLTSAAATGAIRDDLRLEDVANYCIGALDAASTAPTSATRASLIDVLIAGLVPRP